MLWTKHIPRHSLPKQFFFFFFFFILFFLSMSFLFFKYSSLLILLRMFSSPFYLNFILLLPSSFFPLERAFPLTVRFSHHNNTTLLHCWCIMVCVYKEERETDSPATLQSFGEFTWRANRLHWRPLPSPFAHILHRRLQNRRR